MYEEYFFSKTVYFYKEETNIMTSDAFYLTLKTWLEDISPIVFDLHLIPEDRVTQIQNMLHLLGNFTFLNYYYVLIIILRLDLSLCLKSLWGQQIYSWEVTREWGKINALLKKKRKNEGERRKKRENRLYSGITLNYKRDSWIEKPNSVWCTVCYSS